MKELPRIVCKDCNLSQPYRGQPNCLHCGKRLSNWSVASQLRIAEEKEVLTPTDGKLSLR